MSNLGRNYLHVSLGINTHVNDFFSEKFLGKLIQYAWSSNHLSLLEPYMMVWRWRTPNFCLLFLTDCSAYNTVFFHTFLCTINNLPPPCLFVLLGFSSRNNMLSSKYQGKSISCKSFDKKNPEIILHLEDFFHVCPNIFTQPKFRCSQNTSRPIDIRKVCNKPWKLAKLQLQ